METTIQTLCADALERAGLEPSDTARETIHRLALWLDARTEDLDLLDRIELENAVVAYAVDCATAELLETACREHGPLTSTGRPNPALTQAASARTRMHRHLKTIRTLLNKSPRSGRLGERTREAEIERPAPPRQNQQHAAPRPQRDGEAPAEPPRATTDNERTGEAVLPVVPNASTMDPAGECVHLGTPAVDDRRPTAESTPPPMNRAQRRAQARLQARVERKERKRNRRKPKRAETRA